MTGDALVQLRRRRGFTLAGLLSAGGKVEQCGWLKDRYGVSWQIVPTVLPELLGRP